MDEIKRNSNIIQNIILENREKLNISGVIDVFSFDDQIIIVETDLGLLTIKGDNYGTIFMDNIRYKTTRNHRWI